MAYQPKVGQIVRVLVEKSWLNRPINTNEPHIVKDIAIDDLGVGTLDGQFYYAIKPHQVAPWSDIESKRAELARLAQEIAELEAQEAEANRPKSPADELAELEADLRRTHYLQYTVKNRVVVAVMRVSKTFDFTTGIAICAPNDEFDLATGKLIALSRALGREVDTAKYGRAHEPEQIEVGDIVETTCDEWMPVGTQGTLIEIDDEDTKMPYLVRFDDGPYDTLWIEADGLELAAKKRGAAA